MRYSRLKNKAFWTSSLSYLNTVENAYKNMGITEKVLTIILAALLTIGAAGMLLNLDKYVSTRVPASGGSFSEAIVGTPRFINPLLALTDSDRDLVMLTYSGLMRATGDGLLVPDLAKSYSVSKDGKTYTFILKDDAVFHDGAPVTADDIIFTIESAQNPLLKSSKRADWDGVTVEKAGDKSVTFTLPKPYVPFLENTTLGILPKHLWENVQIQEFSFSNLNIKPIGSGPYAVDKISYNKSGIPKAYTLKSNKHYTLGAPYIQAIHLSFLNNKKETLEAWKSGTISAVSGVSISQDFLSPENLQQITYPRIFAVFFNQDKAKIFADKHVRSALNKSIDKQKLINEVMGGYASVLSSAIPNGVLRNVPSTTAGVASVEQAQEMLEDGKWEFTQITDEDGKVPENAPKVWHKGDEVLEFTLATANTPELVHASEMLKVMWRKLGVRVKVETFEANELNQNTIRARNYDALLFGEVVGRSLDLFAFWHSSQRDDPGLNIALYANAKMDKLLENARKEPDERERVSIYNKISKIMSNDTPAIFLYSPDFIYILPNSIKGAELHLVATPSERFAEVHRWYIETNRVWDLFIK